MSFDPLCGWTLNASVSLRPERFGALAYDFDTRRLSFLKSPELLDVVTSLGVHADALAACRAAGVSDAEVPRYMRALATLAETRMIVPRAAAA
jgi:putative mycofactocin binding protein MftB